MIFAIDSSHQVILQHRIIEASDEQTRVTMTNVEVGTRTFVSSSQPAQEGPQIRETALRGSQALAGRCQSKMV